MPVHPCRKLHAITTLKKGWLCLYCVQYHMTAQHVDAYASIVRLTKQHVDHAQEACCADDCVTVVRSNAHSRKCIKTDRQRDLSARHTLIYGLAVGSWSLSNRQWWQYFFLSSTCTQAGPTSAAACNSHVQRLQLLTTTTKTIYRQLSFDMHVLKHATCTQAGPTTATTCNCVSSSAAVDVLRCNQDNPAI